MHSLWLYLLANLFFCILSTLIAVLIPGFLIVRTIIDKNSRPIFSLVLSYCVGLSLLGAQAYIFGWFHLRSFSYFLLFPIMYFSYTHRNDFATWGKQVMTGLLAAPKSILVCLTLGVCLQFLQMGGNGLPRSSGTSFWRTNAYDGIFHLGLIESMKSTFPPQEPSSSGLAVVNYHYWSDLMISEQSRLFGIAPAFLFFQWTPLVLSLLTGLCLYLFVDLLTQHETSTFRRVSACAALIFLYIGSDAGWLLNLYVHHRLSFAYPAIDNGPTQFLNMPHGFGKLFFFCIGVLFLYWRKTRKVSHLALLVFLIAITFGVKIYFGIALALGLALVFCMDAIRIIFNRKIPTKEKILQIRPLFVYGVLFLVGVGAIYLPVNSGAGGLSWYPLEWPKLMINTENVDWTQLNYKIAIAQYLHDFIKQRYYEIVLVLVGLITIHGARMLGFFLTKKTARLFGMDGILFFLIPVLICTFLGFTTLQDSGGFNVFNFFAVSMSILCVSLAFFCAWLFEKNKILGSIVLLLVVALSLPRSVYETSTMLSRYTTGYDQIMITPDEREAFAYLRAHPNDGVVATSLEDTLESKSPYIIAYSGRPEYFAGKYLLETHNQPFTEKEKNVRQLFSQTSLESFKNAATALGIDTILVHKNTASTPADMMLMSYSNRAVFVNDSILIYDRRTL